MLILFDIDATLIKTSRAGLYAMADTVEDLFDAKPDLDGMDFAGRLDPLIIADMLSSAGHPHDAGTLERFRVRYRARLAERLAVPGTGIVMPGVGELLDALGGEAVTLGLLTGNFPETGRAKLAACGLDPDVFVVNAFGDDAGEAPKSRRQLPPIAMRRFEERTGRGLAPGEVTVIGDTPNDVDCARANGCRALAVATGIFDENELRRTGPDLCVADLADTARILSWLLGG